MADDNSGSKPPNNEPSTDGSRAPSELRRVTVDDLRRDFLYLEATVRFSKGPGFSYYCDNCGAPFPEKREQIYLVDGKLPGRHWLYTCPGCSHEVLHKLSNGNTEGLPEYSLAEFFGDQQALVIENEADPCPTCFAEETGTPEIVWVTDWEQSAALFTCPSCGEKFLLRIVDPHKA